ncbi:MAG: hypothetical protein WD894_16605 [Pirellulales bacterium]
MPNSDQLSDQLPRSNADTVAFQLVSDAVIDDVLSPGAGLARLLDKMAVLSREVAGEHGAAKVDWQELVTRLNKADDSEIKSTVGRQELTFGNMWSTNWMLSKLAKHLYEEIERLCLDSPASSAIESIEYADDGTVRSWSLRRRG